MQDGIDDMELMYVGCLPVELDPDEQDVRSLFLEGRAISALPTDELSMHMPSLFHAPYAFAFYLLPEVSKPANGLQEVFGQILGETCITLSCLH